MSRVEVVSAVIAWRGRILFTQRDPRSSYPWTWESAGGKVELGEGQRFALARELREELGVDALIGDRLASFDFDPPEVDRALRVTFYRVDRFEGTPRALQAIGIGWFLPVEVLGLRLAPANARFREGLMDLARRSA